MFSGIVEEAAQVVAVDRCGGNVDLTVKAVMAPELKIDQSVAHNGVCLTVVAVDPAAGCYRVTAVPDVGYWFDVYCFYYVLVWALNS